MKRLQNLSYKTLFTIFFLALAGIIFFLKIGGKTEKVSATWWDDMWHYRKAVSIDNSGSSITNQYVKVTLDTSSLITANKMEDTCDDIRITNINGNLLKHFIDGNTNYDCNEDDTSIYVLVDSIPSSGSTVYIYYGNSSATNVEPKLGSESNPGISCKNIFEHRNDNEGDKDYYITPSGNLSDSIKVHCNMSNNGGGWTLVWHGLPSEAIVLNTDHENISLSNNIVFNNMWIQGTNLDFGITSPTTETAQLSKSIPQYYYEVDQAPDATSPRINFHDLDGNQDVLLSNNYFMFGYGNNWRVFYTCINVSSINYLYIGGHTPTCVPRSSFISEDVGCVSSNYCSNARNTTPKDSGLNLSLYEYQESEVYVKENEITLLTDQSMGSIATEELSPAPIAYWKFDEGIGTTAYDSSSNQNNGRIIGTTLPTWQATDNCLNGNCLFFPGGTFNTNYVSTIKSLPISNIFTIQHWVRTTTGGYSVYNTGSGSGYRFGISNGRVRFLIGNNNGYTETSCGVRTVNDDKWHMITGIYNNTTNKFTCYIDGTYEANVNIVDFTGFQNASPNLGGYTFKGFMDEVKIYPYARTADQILQDYNSRGSLSGSSVNLGVQSNTAPSLKSSLVAYYKFDEGIGTTVYDSSPNKKTGTFIGNTLPTWSSNCKSKNCINFTATNGTKISTNATYNNSSEYTISAYIYPTSVNADQFRIILGSAMGNNIDSGLVLPPDGSLNICYHNYSGTGDTNYCSTTNPMILNQWQYVALTFNNNQVNVYHNGINVKNADVGKTNTNNYTVIGGSINYDYSGRRFFNGSIDEVKIYNKALTADQIKQDYNAGSAIQFGSTNQTIGGTTTSLEYCIPGDTSACSAPIAEWNFEENTGTTAKDTSGNNNNGTFGTGSSAPTWSLGVNNKGAGVNFDGSNDYVSISNSISLQQTENYTLETWFKPENNTAAFFILKNGEYGFKWNGSTSALQYYDQGYNSSSKTSWNLNQWYHLTMVKIGNTASLYINSVLDSSANSTITHNTSFDLEFGRYGGAYFNGSIDGVKIYNYARTPAQITYDYNKGAPIAHWKFDECQGNIVNDSSGVGNTGVIVIGSSGTQNSLGTCQIGTSASWTNGASGKINSSLNFDGTDDYLNIGSLNNFSGNHQSISFWAKTFSFSDFSGFIDSSLGGGSTTVRLYLGYYYSGQPYFTVWLGNGTTAENINMNYSIPLNQWKHYTVTLNNSEIKFYVDGILNQNKTTTITNASGIYKIANGFAGAGYFNGQIDDVRIYNYALTSEQVKTVYNNGAINFN